MMKRSNKFVMIAAASVLFLAFCGSKKTKILIDGSSTVYPITEGVAEEYRKVDSNVHVTVGISGTGGGFKKFCNGETDISDASRHIKPKEKKACGSKKIGYLELPVAYDGLAVIVNPKNKWVKELTVKQLKQIFDAKKPAKTWKDVDPSFPNKKIKVFSPGQDSGTFDYFVETIIGKKDKIRSDATFSEDDNVLVTGVSGEEAAIGFFGVAYYQENKDKLKITPIVNPKTKKAEIPTLKSVKNGDYAPLSRPIFIYVSSEAKKKKPVEKFVNFYLDKAGQMSKDVGYIPLPKKKYAELKKKFASF